MLRNHSYRIGGLSEMYHSLNFVMECLEFLAPRFMDRMIRYDRFDSNTSILLWLHIYKVKVKILNTDDFFYILCTIISYTQHVPLVN